MDKRTRVINALDGKPVDRVPVSFWYHYTGDRAVGEGCVKAHLDYYRTTDIDFIKIMSDGFFEYCMEKEIKTLSDWKDLRPQGRKGKYISEQLERAKRINDELKGECCTFYNVFAPFSTIRFASSNELVMKHLKQDRKTILDAMKVVAEDNAELARLLVSEGGCTGIYLALQGGELDRFSYDEYRELITPGELAVLESARQFSDYNIAHLCAWAGDKNRLEVWRDYPVKAFNWAIFIEEMSLAEGRSFFGGKTILGGFDNRDKGVLYSGTKDEIQKFTRELVANNDSLGLILGADCSLSSGIDTEHISWVVEAVKGC